MNYYNDNDPKACEWLRSLIKAGQIPPGEVDERSITEVRADELRDFTQCHFFAGIGGWPYALQLAGWPDDRPVWTGSCPCQPFSTAGKRKAQADERDLWPAFHRLIAECRPPTVFGEQVASPDTVGTQLEADFVRAFQRGDYARANQLAERIVAREVSEEVEVWIDRVQADLAKEGYALGCEVLGAHSVGAPHIRQRLWWVASRACVAEGERLRAFDEEPVEEQSGGRCTPRHADAQELCGPPHANGTRPPQREEQPARQERQAAERDGAHGVRGHAHADSDGRQTGVEAAAPARPWDSFVPMLCNDGRHRRTPAEPAFFPLADGLPGRVAQLRGLGNAIVPQVAAEFIGAYLETAGVTNG